MAAGSGRYTLVIRLRRICGRATLRPSGSRNGRPLVLAIVVPEVRADLCRSSLVGELQAAARSQPTAIRCHRGWNLLTVLLASLVRVHITTITEQVEIAADRDKLPGDNLPLSAIVFGNYEDDLLVGIVGVGQHR